MDYGQSIIVFRNWPAMAFVIQDADVLRDCWPTWWTFNWRYSAGQYEGQPMTAAVASLFILFSSDDLLWRGQEILFMCVAIWPAGLPLFNGIGPYSLQVLVNDVAYGLRRTEYYSATALTLYYEEWLISVWDVTPAGSPFCGYKFYGILNAMTNSISILVW